MREDGDVDELVGRFPQYDVFADEFHRHAEYSLYNAYYDRPACFQLLGDVMGKRVLDAACGPGLYASELIRRGAQVTGFDQSARMIEICWELRGADDFRVHDLNDPLGWLPDASFDLVLCALALEYVDDRVGALREMRRVLKPDGAVVLSRTHPTGDWLRHGGNYHQARVVSEPWSDRWQQRYWQMPLQVTCEEIAEAGFLIERLLEPLPVPQAAAINPDDYERLCQAPIGIMTFRLRPTPR